MSGRLAGKVALITGTGGGQGRSAAQIFAREGAKVVGCDLKVEADQQTVELVRAAGGEMVTSRVDLGDEDEVRRWIDLAVETYGDFDILYNNASAARYGKTPDFTAEDWRFLIRNELDLVFWATKYAYPVLKRRGGGSIINTASLAGVRGSTFDGTVYQFAHCMTKGGVIAMGRAWAAEFADDNIRVNSISPGLIETPASIELGWVKERTDRAIAKQLVKRMGQPEDIAYCALYLASNESAFCTGQNFCIDGGLTAI